MQTGYRFLIHAVAILGLLIQPCHAIAQDDATSSHLFGYREQKKEGFGILTTIDVRQTMKQKLDKDFRKYAILGACNPPLAHRALTATGAVGLLLPCNVVVESIEGGGSRVTAMDPEAGMTVMGVPALNEVAAEVKAKLSRAISSLV